MEKTDLWSAPITISREVNEPISEKEESKTEKKYVIKAYINKSTTRQMYLSGWDDSDDWMITIVPYEASMDRCKHLISKAEKQIEEANKTALIKKKFPDCINFEITEV